MATDVEFLFSGDWGDGSEGKELAMQMRVLEFWSIAHVG